MKCHKMSSEVRLISATVIVSGAMLGHKVVVIFAAYLLLERLDCKKVVVLLARCERATNPLVIFTI